MNPLRPYLLARLSELIEWLRLVERKLNRKGKI
jgi:hypothetical protein